MGPAAAPPGRPAAGGDPLEGGGRGYGAYGATVVAKAKAESAVAS